MSHGPRCNCKMCEATGCGAFSNRHLCTPDTPWSPAVGGRAIHPAAVEIGTRAHGDIAIYRCPTCKHQWEAELAQ